MITRPVTGFTPFVSCLVLLSQLNRVLSAAPAPSGANSNQNNGGISLSAIPGLGSLTKHKWWVWLLVSIGGALAIIIVAFTIRGVLRYKRHKKIQEVKQQALNASRAEDEELGVGTFKPHPTDFTNPMYVAAKPWDATTSQDSLLLNAFRIPQETSLAGSRGLPQFSAAHSQREVERRTGRHGPRPAGPHAPASRLNPAGLARQNSM